MSVKVSISECRAGGEPKIFDGEKGSKVARIEVAHNETTGENGRKETRWFQAVAFGPAARFVQEHVHKGTNLTITDAELHYGRAYEDKAGMTRTPDELHIVPGRGRVELKEAVAAVAEFAGERQKQASAPQHNQ